MSTASTRGKLFAAFARRLGYVTEGQLDLACQARRRDPARELADILVAQGAIDARNRAIIEEVVESQLALHAGNAEACFAGILDKGWVPTALFADGSEPPTAAGAPMGPEPPVVAWEEGHADALTETVTLGSYTSGGSRYELLERKFSGGMGEVWLARDRELNREVLLKQVLPQLAENARNRGRFLRETRTGAILEHPGIVPVYDIGQHPGGQLFQVMRYFRPGSLHKKIAAYHLAHPDALDELAFRTLLGHFATACRAIEYVHTRGILHLDIKPQNIVTGDFGETQIIDWGLAQITDADMLEKVHEESGNLASGSARGDSAAPASREKSTATNVLPRGLRGTPAYAAPEQWTGDPQVLGPWTDVYGLGATLFEILAGKTPFKVPSPMLEEDVEIGNLHREVKPWVPANVRAICRKAMAVKPGDRYATAAALADDIDRFLADEPVAAWPDPWRVRLWRFVKRHRTAVAAAGMLLATTTVALAIGNVLVARERDVAVRNSRMARQVIQELNVEIGDDFWSTIPQADARRVFMMSKAVDHYRQLVRDHPFDRGILREAAEAMRRLANLFRATGQSEEAMEMYRESLGIQEALPNRTELEWRDLIDTEADRAGAILASSGAEAAIPWHARARKIAEGFSSQFPGSRLALSVKARTTTDLASSYDNADQPDEAIRLFDVAIESYRVILAREAPIRDDTILAVAAMIDAMRCYRRAGESGKAARLSGEAMAAAANLLKMANDDPNHRLLWALGAREQALSAQPPLAVGVLDPIVSELQTILHEHPDIDGFKTVLAETLIDAAELAIARTDSAVAQQAAEKAAVLLAEVSGDEAREMRAKALLLHGRAAVMAGDKQTAQISLRSASDLCRQELRGRLSPAVAALRTTIESELEALQQK